MRALFQTGPGMISRFGDMITNSTLESLQSFERTNWARLCKDKIAAGVCNDEDVPGYFLRKIFLVAPIIPADVSVHANRLEVHLTTVPGDDTLGLPTNAPTSTLKCDWGCIYATAGPWRARLMSRPTIRELVRQTQEQVIGLQRSGLGDNYSFSHLLSRLIDAVHPSHQLPAAVLANPGNAAAIIKRRLRTLGYNTALGLGATTGQQEDGTPFDAESALGVILQIGARLQREHRFYFEFSAPDKTSWRIGFTAAKKVNASAHARYPGDDAESFGFASTGEIFYQGTAHSYVNLQDDSMYFMGFRTWGVVVDVYEGRIFMVVDGELQHVAFGSGAMAFSRHEQRRQRNVILSSELIPTFALQVTEAGAAYAESPQIRVNFGNNPFKSSQVDALPCGDILRHHNTAALDTTSIIDKGGEGGEGTDAEDEDRLRSSMDKTYFRANLAVEAQRSFSQFPPSIYRRSMACTRIQRAWRRMRGRMMRAKIREEQYIAATLIQLVARKKLKRLRAVKNEAAAKIQRNWRRKKLIWLALMRCIYQEPIPELHRAATVIQRKWRNWHMFKNSPIAARYNAKIEDLTKAVNTIIAWWRPLHHQLSEVRRLREKYQAARNIQRVWRGYSLRQLLRPDLRQRLRALGESVARHRKELLRIHGAYIIQSGWRSYLHKRVRAEKVRTRHRAAARIQALWKGYWVRSHIHLRFSYGEAIFLTAVCRSLRTSHFILKMYRPCGIVCPRREVSYTRDGQKIGKA
ncbi:hypothetical protein DFJ77DRAFT_163161 [Powellomyces hirtus]|nr:hypothetical protein DFJ77DRAFT_163161 [Powellomyces hirtus]